MAKKVMTENQRLFAEAQNYLVGGVDSPVRSFTSVGGTPISISRGKGALVYDYDGNTYIDYVLSWGASILGHANREVIRDTKRTIDAGFHFGTTNRTEVALARTISEAIGFIKKIRFVNSGTEAVMGAIRLARGVTGREKIVKFEHAYHGHADYLLAKGGSGLATLNIPTSTGVPKSFINETIIARFGDTRAIEKIFKKEGRSIAAVIVEPVGGNYGVTVPDKKYLQYLRNITSLYGSLLIFDEVITGFRFGYGSSAQRFGITPDLVCLGKIIGGGLPIGAYGGSAGIMDHLAPLGKVYQASTFSGNPIVMRSGLSTLGILKRNRGEYDRIANLTQELCLGLEREASVRGIGIKIDYYGSIFSIRFKNKEIFRRFYRRMLERGIYLAPSEFEANFLSFAHTKEHIEKTIECARASLGKAKGEITYGRRTN